MKQQGIIIQSVDRALQILDCFTGPASELGITELASDMALGKSTVYGLANTLLAAGFLEQNPENKKYRLGIRLFELGSLVQSRLDIREIAKPHLKELSSKFQMTVHMGIYRDGEVIYIDKMDAPNTRIIYSQVGKRAPMHCTGIGKAVFAYLEEEERSWVFRTREREALTPNTLMTEEALRDELEGIRAQGYAVDNEEVELGLRCVAVPIFNNQKKPVAAISISSPAALLSEERISEIAAAIRTTAREVSKRLGYAD